MGKSICVFGASSTWGAYDEEKGGWVNRLILHFNSLSDEQWRAVYNLGISGNITSDIINRFEVEAEARHPGLLIFSMGDNDAAYDSSMNNNLVPIDVFEENTIKLIKQAKKFTEKILLIGIKDIDETKTTPIPWRPELHYLKENLQNYDKKLKEIAQAESVHYVSLEGLLSPTDLDDGLHPNGRGHEKIFQVVLKELSKVL